MNDPRASIEERYKGRDEYVGRVAAAALDLVRQRYLLAEDGADVIQRAIEHWQFATNGATQ